MIMVDELIALGRRIAELRNKRGLTQEKLAELTNYSTNHIAKLESARTNPSFELLVNLSRALDVELKELFCIEEDKTSEDIKSELNKLIEKAEGNKIKMLYKILKSID